MQHPFAVRHYHILLVPLRIYLVLKRDKVFQVHGLGDDVEETQIQHPQALRTDLYP